MGPHSFKCGSKDSRIRDAHFCPGLQWGRTLSSAEVLSWRKKRWRKPPLQWGRTLSSAEVIDPERNNQRRSKRFNGAALFQVRKYGKISVW